jgi:FRG domain-containing protein
MAIADMTDRISSFSQLSEALQPFRGGHWVFRGVSDPAHDLLPKVGRAKQLALHEKRIFAAFKREAPALTTSTPGDNWQLMALAQHHGLPTRLLDWTENPLVAAYFASDQSYDRDGVLYAMDNRHVVKEGVASPFEVKAVMRYRPRHITRRIQASAAYSPFILIRQLL